MSDARRMTEPGHPPKKAPDEPEHWLVKPSTSRTLWIVFIVLTVLVAAADLVVEHYRHFVVGGTFGFYVWFGLGSTVLLFGLAKVVGGVLQRPETYYAGSGSSGTAGAPDTSGASDAGVGGGER
ncbi:MAG: hypothetical protein U5R14_07865 [Gemmatimonadota bacterium]|nr:hypothetical protein [Gemmatimonadota bacterium]